MDGLHHFEINFGHDAAHRSPVSFELLLGALFHDQPDGLIQRRGAIPHRPLDLFRYFLVRDHSSFLYIAFESAELVAANVTI